MQAKTAQPTPFPWVEPGFIQALERRFPQRPITPQSPQNDIMFAAGQQDVLRFLREESARQDAIPKNVKE